MKEQWQELKETITEMRDNDGTGTQQEVCKFLANYMETLEKQMQESKWITVSKDCPKKKGWYITTRECGKYHFIDYDYFDGENWLEQRPEWRKLVYAYDIIAWMPKPEPYEDKNIKGDGGNET